MESEIETNMEGTTLTQQELDSMSEEQRVIFNRILRIASDIGWTLCSPYTNSEEKMKFKCSGHHDIAMLNANFERRRRCPICNGNRNSKEASKANFLRAMVEINATVVGEYVGKNIPIHVICTNGHDCYPYPTNVQKGRGICRNCLSLVVEREFYERIAALGGQVIGPYIDASTPCPCICPNGHAWAPVPCGVRQRERVCAHCPCPRAKQKFYDRIAALGGRVVGPYVGVSAPCPCICVNNHECAPHPAGVNSGQGICNQCMPFIAQREFYERITALGGRVIGPYINTNTPCLCICSKNHECTPYPSGIQQGGGMCMTCAPSSIGEEKIVEALTKLNLQFKPEFSIDGKRRYDFLITFEGKKFICEFDGIQHFEVGGIWVPTREILLQKQQIDRDKIKLANEHGYRIFRIDHTWSKRPIEDFMWIIQEMMTAMERYNYPLMVTDPSMYQWLIPSQVESKSEEIVSNDISQLTVEISTIQIKSEETPVQNILLIPVEQPPKRKSRLVIVSPNRQNFEIGKSL